MVVSYIHLNVDEVVCGKSASFYSFPPLNKISFCERLPDERGKKERSFLKAPLFFASFIPVGAESIDSGVVGVSASVLLISGKDSAQCRSRRQKYHGSQAGTEKHTCVPLYSLRQARFLGSHIVNGLPDGLLRHEGNAVNLVAVLIDRCGKGEHIGALSPPR